jgi:hypothetical protein
MKPQFRSGGHNHHLAENKDVPTTGCRLLCLSNQPPVAGPFGAGVPVWRNNSALGNQVEVRRQR